MRQHKGEQELYRLFEGVLQPLLAPVQVAFTHHQLPQMEPLM